MSRKSDTLSTKGSDAAKDVHGIETQDEDLPTSSSSWIDIWHAKLEEADKKVFGTRKSYALSSSSFQSILEIGDFPFGNVQDDVTFEVTIIDLRKNVIRKKGV